MEPMPMVRTFFLILLLLAPPILTGLLLFGEYFKTVSGQTFNLYDATCMSVTGGGVLERHNSCGRGLDIVQIFLPVAWIINIIASVPLLSVWAVPVDKVQDSHRVLKHSPTLLLLISFTGMLVSFLMFNNNRDDIKFIETVGQSSSQFGSGDVSYRLWLSVIVTLGITTILWGMYAVTNGFNDWFSIKAANSIKAFTARSPNSGAGVYSA